MSATEIIIIENSDAKIPAITIWLALFLPYISEIMSVTKKVIGYGKIPTESSNNFFPKISIPKKSIKINF